MGLPLPTSWCRILVALTAVFATTSPPLHADPITAVTGANFFIFRAGSSEDGPLVASLTFHSDFSDQIFVGSSVFDPVLQFEPLPALTYEPGQTVNLSRRFFTDGVAPGTRSVAGGGFESVFFTADFQLTAPDSGIGTGIPYVWTGTLTVASDTGLDDVLFSGLLSGTGEASMFFADRSPGEPLALTRIVYGGDSPAPVPEPGTAVLLGAGLLGAATVRRLRQLKG
jgi:hypothetical protein